MAFTCKATACAGQAPFGVVTITVFKSRFKMLFWNLIYTSLPKAKNHAVFVGPRKDLEMAGKNQDTSQRQTFHLIACWSSFSRTAVLGISP